MTGLEIIYGVGFVLGGLSLVLFFLGHLGLFTAPFIIAAAFVALILLYFILKNTLPARGRVSRPYTTAELLLLGVSALAAVLAVPLALTPPTVRDELIQHLAVPKLYLLAGRIYELTFMGFSYLPVNIDLLYAVPMSVGSDVAPRLIHLGFALLTGLVVFSYLEREAGRAYAALGLLLYISTPLVFNLSRMAYIDHGAAFYSTLALVAALRWREDFSYKWIVFSALAMGLALGAKYNTLITLLLVTLFFLFEGVRQRRGLKAAVLFVVIAMTVVSPWLVRNHLWKGSPLYPLYESAVKASAKGEGFHVTTEMAPLVKRAVLYDEGIVKILATPVRIFYEGRDNSIEKFDGVLNPLFLLFIPLAFIRRRTRGLKYLGLFAGLFFLMAFFTVDLVVRYLMPALPALVIMAVFGIKNLSETRGLKGPAIGLVAVMLAFNAVYIGGLYKSHGPLGYISGGMDRDGYLEERLPDYKVISYANENLPTDARVLFFFTGDRGYYWDRDYSYGDRLGGNLVRYVKRSAGPTDLLARLRRSGFTHLFIHEALFTRFVNDNFDSGEQQTLAGLFQLHLKRLYGANGFALYALEPPTAAP